MRTTHFMIMGLLALLTAGAASAAEIHGTVSEDGKSVPKGTALKLECAGTTASAATDEFGGYSLKIAATGPCKLTVDYKGGSASTAVTVYDKPGKYDLAVKSEGGKLTLTRK